MAKGYYLVINNLYLTISHKNYLQNVTYDLYKIYLL